jgi:exosortase
MRKMSLPRSQKTPRMCAPRDVFVALLLGAAAAVASGDAWLSTFRIGSTSEELSYVLLAPLMIVWIAWVRRQQLGQCRLRRGWVGLLLLAVGWGVYGYGRVADPVIWRAGAVIASGGAVVAALGTEVLRRFAPAFASMAFLIPISPDGRYKLAGPLQEATATATQSACDVLGILVDRTGNLLTINGVDVTVAEACNGMRMILTLFMVCYVVAFTQRLHIYLRVGLLLASPLVAVVANVARLVPTVWLFGHAPAATADKFHSASGWVMAFVAFALLMVLCRWGQRLLEDSHATPPGASAIQAVPQA